MARIVHQALLLTAASALKPTRRLFFSNAAGAACGVALPALADSGVPMDLGPLGLRNGGSGKLNSCPPQGIKRVHQHVQVRHGPLRAALDVPVREAGRPGGLCHDRRRQQVRRDGVLGARQRRRRAKDTTLVL